MGSLQVVSAAGGGGSSGGKQDSGCLRHPHPLHIQRLGM